MARAETGLTRERVAQLAGCSVSYLQLLEGGFDPNGSDVRPRVESVLRDALRAIHNDYEPQAGLVEEDGGRRGADRDKV